MRVNEDPEVAQLRGRVTRLERSLRLTVNALEAGCAITPRDRAAVITAASMTLGRAVSRDAFVDMLIHEELERLNRPVP